MRNSDKVKYVGISTGGQGVYGAFGTKVRFAMGGAVDRLRRTKELEKLGAKSIHFVELPSPMTKADAVQFLATQVTESTFTTPVVKDAIARATARLLAGKGKKTP